MASSSIGQKMKTSESETPATDTDLDQLDYVRFTWSDIHGIPRAKSIPRRYVERVWTDGVRPYSGIQAFGPRTDLVTFPDYTSQGNCLELPVPGTIHCLPWAGPDGVNVGSVLCESYTSDGEPHGACSRTEARKQLDALHKEFGLKLMSSFEVEFVLLHKDTLKPLFEDHDAYTTQILAEAEHFLYHAEQQLAKAGVDILAINAEFAPGQYEFGSVPKFGIESADSMFKFKAYMKEVADQAGYLATFMTKPMLGVCGAGNHLNHSLWDHQGINAFHDPKAPDQMSDTCRHWLAGLIKHTPAITALSCPTANCYRRLHTIWVPHVANWGIDNRTITYRVKNYSAESTYIEHRIPSSACNPYLSLAAVVAAGLDGLRNKLPLPPPLQQEATELPHTLEQALVALETDDVIKSALSERFMSWFLEEKRQVEVAKFKGHDMKGNSEEELLKERDMYLKFI